MACHGNNATPPAPADAPGADLISTRQVAERIGRLCEEHGHLDPRLPQLVPGFDAPFFQAGLAGYSEAPMRLVARRHGCPLCVTEALLDRTLLAGGRGFAKADLGELHDNVPGGSEDHPLSGQIMGSEPREMAAAAVKMVEQRARTDGDYRALVSDGALNAHAHGPAFEAIDVNLACPVKKIARKARGGHWLAEPSGAIRILEQVREALPAAIPTSVKLRRSFDDTPEMTAAFNRIVDAAFSMGYAWITVHGRTVRQKYVGPSRWAPIRDVVQRHPDRIIFGSGDVWNVHDIFRMIEYTGVKSVAVARGCIGNPWIFRQARDMMAGHPARPPTVEEQRIVLAMHFDLAISTNHAKRDPEGHTARTMRKFGIRFAAHHPRREKVRVAMTRISSPADWEAVLDRWYGEDAGVDPGALSTAEV